VIDPDAQLGENTTVGPYAVLEQNTVIGDNGRIYAHAMIASGTRLGSGCRVFPNAVLGMIPQDLKFEGEDSLLEVGENTTIRECCTLNRGTNASGTTRVGSNCLLMAYSHIAHDCVVGDNVVIANSLAMAGHVTVAHDVFIGGDVAIHQFCTIGEYATLGAKVYVSSDVVPYALVADSPPKIKGINSIGLTRKGFSESQRRSIKRAYRILFRQGLKLDEACDTLQKECGGNAQVDALVSFATQSSRGLLRM
jgi:UDP-N-acetylglucosamine acyltransferase